MPVEEQVLPPRPLRLHPVHDEGAKSLARLYPAIAAQWDPDRNSITPSQLTSGSNRPIWWLCNNQHSWHATPYARTKGHGCPACAGLRATPENNLAVARPDLLSTWHPERNRAELGLLPTDVLPQSNKKFWWTCPQDPTHDYQASPAARFRGRGCPYCAGKKVNASNSLAGASLILAAEWDPANDKRAEEVARGSDYRAGWICRNDPDHQWESFVSSRPADGAGCPYCDGKRPTDRNRLSLNRPDLADQWHPAKNSPLTPADVTTGSNRRVWWNCPQDPAHVWRTAVRARALDDDGCKQCAPAIRSRIDIALACEFAAVFPDDVDPKSQKRLELGHNRPHTVDILIESLRIVIEFDGSHTHKGDDHEQRDRQKTKRLRDAGYRVVRIREEPLPLLDLKFDVSIERTRRPDVKAITDKVLRHVTELGWVSQEVTRDYLASAEPKATVLAAEIYDSLPPSERFVPYSARKVRNRT
ncbi:zinc-ribbon domain-containing protein [Arthrobacter sp. U41]|uniref:zinc-ribbon domain-containing protein n=1 Tax=Arthrobacter sp. U41 TaxID=1849032 RepID=UPI0009F50251|nr:zinc-ribbon domain-containing protein [Arthrobacter sp. U41]